MTIRNRIIITIAMIVVTIALALISADSAQYSNPITIENGKAMIATSNGTVVYSDVEYITGYAVSVKPSAILTSADSTPSALPNTSSAHGVYTCDNVSNGTHFTVTNDTPCAER